MSVGAVIAAVVLVVLLGPAIGIAPLGDPLGVGSHGSGSPTPNGESYTQARPVADSLSQGQQGGGWSLMLAIGISVPSTVTEPPSSGCPNIQYPNTIGATTQGLAAGWVFVYEKGGSSSNQLTIEVRNGSASVVPGCSTGFPGVVPIPSSVVDSTQASTSAMASGGSTFLKLYPNASAEYGLENFAPGGAWPSGAYWLVALGVCVLSGVYGGPTGTYLEAQYLLNATSGRFVEELNATVACSSGGAPTAAVAMSGTSAGGCSNAAGATFSTFTITVAGSSQPLTTASFGAALTVAGGATATSPGVASGPDGCGESPTTPTGWVLLLDSPAGSQMAVFDATGWHAMNATLPVTLTPGQSFLVVAGSSVSLAQASLALYGTNGAAVTGAVTI